MGKITLFHGTSEKIVVPTYGLGEKKHDYGMGFYLTGNIDLAKEWAVCKPNSVHCFRTGEMMMRAYAEDYLSDVVETQGKLFDFVAQEFPDKDTEEFIKTYMKSNTRKSIDEAQAYVNTMDCKELWEYFLKTEQYSLKNGEGMKGFMPDWIGEFYAYYQWYYNIPSAEVVQKVPIDFLKKAYYGLHDLELDLAVKKVGEE